MQTEIVYDLGASSVMHPISNLYLDVYDFPTCVEGPHTTYTLATLPRSGSTLAAIEFWKTGALGAPMEYLNLPIMGDLITRMGEDDMLAYWKKVISKRTGPNGVFGSKLFIRNLRHIASNHPKLLPHIIGQKVVYLEREDEVAQAVSYLRAAQTKAWFAASVERAPAQYDRDLIDRYLLRVRRQKAAWESVFARLGVVPLRIGYFELVASPREVTDRVAEFIGVSIDRENPWDIPDIEKQSGGESRQWIDRYLSETRAA